MDRLRLRAEGGFTLIELIVVIAVIGVLAAIAIPQFHAYRRRGYDADVKSNVGNAIISQEAYFTHKEIYTSSLADLASWGFKQSSNVNITPTGSPTTFIISGGATVVCTPGTGVWSFASGTGLTTGVTCN